MDENLERRNHYLDLAGIENYTSRFGAGELAQVGWSGGVESQRDGGARAGGDDGEIGD